MHRNYFFIAINIIMVGGQALIINEGGRAFNVTPIDGSQWGISIVLGLLSLLFGVLVRIIPDDWLLYCIPYWLRAWWLPDSVTDIEAQERRRSTRPENLEFIRRIRGGRVNNLRISFGHFAEVSGLQEDRAMVAVTGLGYGR